MTGTEYDYNNLDKISRSTERLSDLFKEMGDEKPQMPRKPIISGMIASLIVVAVFLICFNC